MRLRALKSRRAAIVGASIVAGAVAFAGCSFEGSSADTADVDNGKQLFVQSCGSCHVLNDAGTEGRVGPNLDDAFRGSRQAGFKESQFEGVTKRWIEISQAPMPRDLVVGQDADDVSAYVAQVAGTEEGSPIRAALPPAPEDPAIGTQDGLRRGRFGREVIDVEGNVPANPSGGGSQEGSEGGEEGEGE
jgi:mono/diheme cytochrome c family protein